MDSFLYRYNRFSKSYLINYNNFEFEVEPELFSILNVYFNSKNMFETLKILKINNIYINETDLTTIVNSIQEGQITQDNTFKNRTFEIMDFKIFNNLLKNNIIISILLLGLIMFTILHFYLILDFFVLPKIKNISFSSMILLIPMYYFSKLLFTPVHEFGHYVLYHLFTGKSAKFLITFNGLISFNGITTTDELFYISNPFKRAFISIAGEFFEFAFLTLILFTFQNYFDVFILQLLTVRVILNLVFNMNILSEHTDGHILVTDLLGFTTFSETYSEFLTQIINNKIEPIIIINNRVKRLLLCYTVTGIILIIAFFYTQLAFFNYYVLILLFPLKNLQTFLNSGLITVFILCINYVYYFDLVVRIAQKYALLKNAILLRNKKGRLENVL